MKEKSGVLDGELSRQLNGLGFIYITRDPINSTARVQPTMS